MFDTMLGLVLDLHFDSKRDQKSLSNMTSFQNHKHENNDITMKTIMKSHENVWDHKPQ